MRRSILALPLVLALVVGAPGLAWAGHKFRLRAAGAAETPGQNQVYEMSGKLPLTSPSDLPQVVTDAIQATCLTPTPDERPKVQFIYVRVGGGPGPYRSGIATTGADGSFVTTVMLPVPYNAVTYNVRLRCADDLTQVPAASTTNLVSIPGRTGDAQYTVFTVTVPLAGTGSSSVVLALAGVALLLVGCLLLVSERRLARG